MSLLEYSELQWGDYLAIALYFIAVISVGLWASFKSRSNNLKGYFLASRNMHWIPVGASLFASNIGSEHFIGLAGSGAADGIAVGVFELNAIFVLMLLGWVFVPVYLSAEVFTMPQYLRKRFGGQRIRVFLSCLSLLLYIFTKISADLFSGALFIRSALGFEGQSGLYVSVLILLALAAVFTIGGGLTAVIWTDFVQAILMVLGSIVLTVLSFNEVGGYEKMLDQYRHNATADPEYASYTINEATGENISCSAIKDDFLHLVRPVTDPVMPWTGYFTGIVIGSIWYWCADQVIVQRTLSAKNISHAKGGCVMAAALKLLPLFTLVMPGMAARILFKNEIGCSNPAKCEEICAVESGCSNKAYILLVLRVLPHGLRGIMLAVMLAALMSSLTSIFNSASTIFTMDIWSRFRSTRPSARELLLVGRCCVIGLVAISIAWIPSIATFHSSQLFVYIQAVSNFLAPPVAAVYVLGILWPRLNEQGAFWSMMAGFAVGLVRMGLEFGYKVPPCGSGRIDPRPEWVRNAVGKFHYLHFGGFSFAFTIVVAVIIALLTKPIPKEKLYRLTFWSRHSTKKRIGALDEEDEEENERQEMTIGQDDTTSHSDENAIVKALYKLCCLATKSNTEPGNVKSGKYDVNDVNEVDPKIDREFLHESVFHKRLLNTLSVTVLCAAMFVWGFYA